MNDRELKDLWQQHAVAPPSPPRAGSDRQLVELMRQRMRRFDRHVFWRDMLECGAAAVVALLVALRMFRETSTLARLGNSILLLSCAFIALTLYIARRGQRDGPDERSLRESLVAEAAKVERQIRLLKNVVWWYLLPLLAGATLVELGHRGSLMTMAIILALFAVVGWFVYRLNQRGARGLTAIKADLDRALDSVPEFARSKDDPNPEGETP